MSAFDSPGPLDDSIKDENAPLYELDDKIEEAENKFDRLTSIVVMSVRGMDRRADERETRITKHMENVLESMRAIVIDRDELRAAIQSTLNAVSHLSNLI